MIDLDLLDILTMLLLNHFQEFFTILILVTSKEHLLDSIVIEQESGFIIDMPFWV